MDKSGESCPDQNSKHGRFKHMVKWSQFYYEAYINTGTRKGDSG